MADIEKGSDEAGLIAQMQADTAKAEVLLARIADCAAKVATINHKAGRLVQSADAMIWQGAVGRCLYDIKAAHGVASKALISGYDNGGEIVIQGPGR